MRKRRKNLIEIDIEGEGFVEVPLEAFAGIILLPPSPVIRTSDRVYVVAEESSLKGERGTVVEVMTQLGIRHVRVRLDGKRGHYNFREEEVRKVGEEKAKEGR